MSACVLDDLCSTACLHVYLMIFVVLHVCMCCTSSICCSVTVLVISTVMTSYTCVHYNCRVHMAHEQSMAARMLNFTNFRAASACVLYNMACIYIVLFQFQHAQLQVQLTSIRSLIRPSRIQPGILIIQPTLYSAWYSYSIM